MNSLEKFFYSISVNELREVEYSFSRHYVTRETRQQIEALKEVLGARRYRVAILHFGRGLSPKEIAWRLGIKVQMVRKHLAAIDREKDCVRVAKQRRTLRLDESRDYLQVASLN